MKKIILLLVVFVFFTACEKEKIATDVKTKPCAVVPKAQQSTHFDTVSSYLDLGGILFAYLDISQDAEVATQYLAEIYDAFKDEIPMPVPKDIDVKKLAQGLGLHNVDALGISSIKDGDIYINKTFAYTSGPRQGLMKIAGGEAHEFSIAKMAPKNADIVLEQDVNLEALSTVVQSSIKQVMGPQGAMLLGMLNAPMPHTTITWQKLIEKLNTTVGLVVRMDKTKKITLPGNDMTMPFTEVVVVIDNMGVMVDHFNEMAQVYAKDDWKYQKGNVWNTLTPTEKLPEAFADYAPVLAKHNKSGKLYFASSMKFLEDCMNQKSPISKEATFIKAVDGLPGKGNAFGYISKDIMEKYKSLLSSTKHKSKEEEKIMKLVQKFMPSTKSPTAYVSANTKEGIYSITRSPQSFKSSVLALPAVSIMGIAAAVAVPAFANYTKAANSFSTPPGAAQAQP